MELICEMIHISHARRTVPAFWGDLGILPHTARASYIAVVYAAKFEIAFFFQFPWPHRRLYGYVGSGLYGLGPVYNLVGRVMYI